MTYPNPKCCRLLTVIKIIIIFAIRAVIFKFLLLLVQGQISILWWWAILNKISCLSQFEVPIFQIIQNTVKRKIYLHRSVCYLRPIFIFNFFSILGNMGPNMIAQGSIHTRARLGDKLSTCPNKKKQQLKRQFDSNCATNGSEDSLSFFLFYLETLEFGSFLRSWPCLIQHYIAFYASHDHNSQTHKIVQ